MRKSIKTERINRVSFTDFDFMNEGHERGRNFNKYRGDESIPPADKNVFDQCSSPGDVRNGVHAFDSLKLNHEWEDHDEIDEAGEAFNPSIFDEDIDDAIRIPSLDVNLRWAPENSEIVVPNMGRTTLANAVAGGQASIQGAQLSILEELKKMTKRQSLKQDKDKDWITEADITEKDVICERGGKSNRHAGTKVYRGMIENYKPKYQALTAKTDKTNLSREIIAQIQNKGGRFLKKDEQTTHYFVLCAVETTKKVSQALREKKVLKWTNTKL